jgi:hypothetical protein
MACDLTLFRDEPCKDIVGGIDKLYFVNYGDVTPATVTYDVTDTDVIDAVSGTPSAYEYEVKDATSFTQNIQSDRSTGTTVFEQVLEVTLKKLTVADHKELKLMAWGRPHVIIKDNNGNFFVAGFEHGMDVTGGTIVTGAAMNELSGYTLTLTGMERTPANFLGTDPASAGFTIVNS